MDQLRKRLNSAPLQEILAASDVWVTRGILLAFFLLAFGCAAQAPTEATNLQAGQAAQDQQEYWRAETFFQQAALLAPDDYRPSLALARLHLLEHQDTLARSELETARSLKGDDADIWLTLGDVAQDQNNAQDAEHAWLQATHLTPTTAQMQAHQRLGLLYEQQGHFSEAAAQLSVLPASNTLAQFHLGTLLLEQEKLDAARQAFENVVDHASQTSQITAAQGFLQAIAEWNGSAQSQKLVGFTYIQNKLPALAGPALKQAVTLDPTDPATHAYLGWVYFTAGSVDQARQEEQQALYLDPTNSFAYYTLSQLDISSGHYTTADDALALALATDPHNPVFWAARGTLAEQLNDLASAEQDLQQAVANASGDPSFSLQLATFYAKHQIGLDNGVALEAAQVAVTLNATNGAAYDALGRIQQAMNDFPAAMNALIQAVNCAPTNAVFHAHLGMVLANLGYLRSAELNLRKAIVLDINGPAAKLAQQLLQDLPVIDV
jgi:tetratricopeptide (TPR) repeat protein